MTQLFLHRKHGRRQQTIRPRLEILEDRSLLSTASAQLVFSTYLGGSNYDGATAVAADAAGNVYVTGTTTSFKDFPILNANQPILHGDEDAFVARFDTNGNLLWSTYLGGSQLDQAFAIAVDSSDNVYVTGFTSSPDFPTTSNAVQAKLHGAQDAFVAKFNSSGSLTYGTYLGGTGSRNFNDYTIGNSIAVDAAGHIYITGDTTSAIFQTTTGVAQSQFGGGTDAFVTELNPAQAGSAGIVYSTYVGGNQADHGTAIAVDASGNAYVTGLTAWHNFPTTASAFGSDFKGETAAFVVKLNPGGTLAHATYLGGGNLPPESYTADSGNGIGVDAAGNAYVTGVTFSPRFPTTPGAVQSSLAGRSDAFVAKLDTTKSGANSLVWSTYLGGDKNDEGLAIALDPTGNVAVTGGTSSNDFPTTAGALQSQHNGDNFFVVQLSPSGSLIFSTYLGGSGSDNVAGIAADASGNLAIAGRTTSTDYPTTIGAAQATNGGAEDAFVSKIALTGSSGGGGGGVAAVEVVAAAVAAQGASKRTTSVRNFASHGSTSAPRSTRCTRRRSRSC